MVKLWNIHILIEFTNNKKEETNSHDILSHNALHGASSWPKYNRLYPGNSQLPLINWQVVITNVFVMTIYTKIKCPGIFCCVGVFVQATCMLVSTCACICKWDTLSTDTFRNIYSNPNYIMKSFTNWKLILFHIMWTLPNIQLCHGHGMWHLIRILM